MTDNGIRKNCPRFGCGTDASQIEVQPCECGCSAGHVAYCPDCGVFSEGSSLEEAAMNWNDGNYPTFDEQHDDPVWSVHDWPTDSDFVGPEGP